MITQAVALLPVQVWPNEVSMWFLELNRLILVLWTVELVLKLISNSFKKYIVRSTITLDS